MVVSVVVPLGAGALGPFIVADLALSTAAFGVLGSSFYAGAAIGSHRGARAVRRLGPRRALTFWYGAQLATLLAVLLAGDRYLLLVALFFLNGAGSSAVTPAANAAIGSFRRFRGLAVGLVQSGVPAASLLAGAVIAPLAEAVGWREVLAAVGLVGLLPLATSLLLLRPVSDELLPSSTSGQGPFRGEVSTLHLRWAELCTFLNAVGVAPMYLYSVLYLTADLGGEPVASARLFAVSGLLGVASRLGWGILCQRRNRQRATFVAMAVSAAAVPALMAVATPDTRWVAALAILAVGWSAAWMVLVNAALVESTTTDVASSTGAVYRFYFAGLLLSAPLFGAVVDATQSYRAAWLISLAALSVAAAIVCSGRLWTTKPTAAPGSGSTSSDPSPHRDDFITGSPSPSTDPGL